MSGIFDTIANTTFSYDTGASGTVTAGAAQQITFIACHATAGGATLTITPKGPKQTASAGGAIPIPPGWFGKNYLMQLGPGTVLAFSGTDSYYVEYGKIQ